MKDAARRIDRLERIPAASGGCPHCPPVAFQYDDGGSDGKPLELPTCQACGRPVAVAVVFGYDEAPAGAQESER